MRKALRDDFMQGLLDEGSAISIAVLMGDLTSSNTRCHYPRIHEAIQSRTRKRDPKGPHQTEKKRHPESVLSPVVDENGPRCVGGRVCVVEKFKEP